MSAQPQISGIGEVKKQKGRMKGGGKKSAQEKNFDPVSIQKGEWERRKGKKGKENSLG